MGDALSCNIDYEGPYDLYVRVLHISEPQRGWKDVRAEVTLRDITETTPEGKYKGISYVWNFPAVDSPWVFPGEDLGNDVLSIRLLGVDKEMAVVPLAPLELPKGEVTQTVVQVGNYSLTLELRIVETPMKEEATEENALAPDADGPDPFAEKPTEEKDENESGQ